MANFRCHGNKGMSEPSGNGIVELANPKNHTIEPKITDTNKLADPEYPLVGARIWGVSPVQAEL